MKRDDSIFLARLVLYIVGVSLVAYGARQLFGAGAMPVVYGAALVLSLFKGHT